MSSASATSSTDLSDADRQWEENMEQIKLALNLMVFPFVGKFLGRRFAYAIWSRVMEWRYPVKIDITSRRAFNIAGLFTSLFGFW